MVIYDFCLRFLIKMDVALEIDPQSKERYNYQMKERKWKWKATIKKYRSENP